MKNYVQRGDTLTLIAPYTVVSGAGMLVGSLFAVAQTAAASGAAVEGDIDGVYDLVKLAGTAWTQGARIYWDDTAKNCTVVSSTNKLIGVATQAALSADVVGRVYLTAAFTI